jgi:hypothetical protein
VLLKPYDMKKCFPDQKESTVFVREVDRRLRAWIEDKRTGMEERYYLLQYWDMWCVAVEYVARKPPYYFTGSWTPEEIISLGSIPAPFNLHPFPVQHMFEERDKFMYTCSSMTTSEESHFPFITVIGKAWEGKYQRNQVSTKFVKSITNKDHLYEVSPWMIECFIMTCLGAYHFRQKPLLHWTLRRDIVRWWRLRWQPKIFQRDSLILSVSYSAELLLALKEFIVFSVDSHVHWREWYNHCYPWNENVKAISSACDHFRSSLVHSTIHALASNDPIYEKIEKFLEDTEKTTDITQPRCFLLFAKQILPPSQKVVNESPLIDPQLVADFWDLRLRFLSYEPTSEESKYAYSRSIRSVYLRPFLLYHRIFLIWCTALHVPLSETKSLLDLIATYYSDTRCKPKAVLGVWSHYRHLHPTASRLISDVVQGYRRNASLQVRVLPHGWIQGQLLALEELYPSEKNESVPRCDFLYYCPSCKDLHSNVTRFRSRGSSRARRFDPNESSGYSRVTVDTDNSTLYCGRKNGQTAKKCQSTELEFFPMIGKWLILNGHTYAMCGQRGCGGIMELDKIGTSTKKTKEGEKKDQSYSVVRPNDWGLPCARCFDSLFHRDVTYKVKQKKQKQSEYNHRFNKRNLKLMTTGEPTEKDRLKENAFDS